MYVKGVLFDVVIEAPLCTFQDALAPREVADTIVEPSALAAWHMAPQAPMVPWNTVGVVAPGLIRGRGPQRRVARHELLDPAAPR